MARAKARALPAEIDPTALDRLCNPYEADSSWTEAPSTSSDLR